MPIRVEKFTTFDIIKIFKVNIDLVNDWLTRGFIYPSIKAASGQGTKNIFSKGDLYRIGLFLCLKNRWRRRTAAEIAMSVRDKEWKNLSPRTLEYEDDFITTIIHLKEIKTDVDKRVA